MKALLAWTTADGRQYFEECDTPQALSNELLENVIAEQNANMADVRIYAVGKTYGVNENIELVPM